MPVENVKLSTGRSGDGLTSGSRRPNGVPATPASGRVCTRNGIYRESLAPGRAWGSLEAVACPLGRVCQALDHAAGIGGTVRPLDLEQQSGFGSNNGALMPLEQQRCSIVVVTGAGRTADPGCGAGARGSRGTRESRDACRPGAQARLSGSADRPGLVLRAGSGGRAPGWGGRDYLGAGRGEES